MLILDLVVNIDKKVILKYSKKLSKQYIRKINFETKQNVDKV